MTEPAYTYKAHVTDVHDGDTITCVIDLGLCVFVHGQKIRFLGINAPELKKDSTLPNGPGEAARDYLDTMITGKDVIIETHKDSKEKYGRWLGVIWALDPNGAQFNVNDQMLKSNHAVVMKS